ncbi:MAG: segregation and condensation protein A [Chloroflexota bacterium]
MSLDTASHQAKGYTVSTPVYEGPLDLLLQLIERAELDITKLALAQVTDQYLQHLRAIRETASPDEVSAFLVIAARLVQIKSEALLPVQPTRQPDEEDPGEALAQQLIAYKRYRQIANLLAEREVQGLRTYLRLAPPPKIEGSVDLSGLTLADLIAAAQAIFAPDRRPQLNTVVRAPKVTIRDKIKLIAQTLRQRGRATFSILLGSKRTRLDVVVTFLAMLELAKRRLVNVTQETLFGEIDIEASEAWDENSEFELEFGE